jgi:hypothetical protein
LTSDVPAAAERIEVGDYDGMVLMLSERGWGDGLPVAPSSPERVEEFIAASGRDGFEVIGHVPPVYGEATVEKVAANAVMAGCLPTYMPLLLRTLQALLDPTFNLLGVQATTHPCAPIVIVSGPEADRLSMNFDYGAFGPGNRANATIGRAVRLMLLNLGGAKPGVLDLATQGSPAKYAYCIAENEAATPWEPYRVLKGFSRTQTTVTVAALEAPHNINDHGSTTGSEILRTIAGVMAAPSNQVYLLGTEPFLFLCPEHATTLASDGLGPRDLQDHLFAKARVRSDQIGAGHLARLRKVHASIPLYRELGLDAADLTEIPIVTAPGDINILVVGGPSGRHSSFAPSIGAVGRSVTLALE